MLCGAKLRGRDAYCQKHGMFNGRCRNHGGASLSGQSHPNWKHGRRSKDYIVRGKEARERLRELINLGRSIGVFID